MIDLNDIYSLSDFQRKTREHVERLKQTGKPTVLTVNGKAEIVVQNASAYQALLDLVDQAEAIVAIQRGLRSFERGEGRPAEDVFDDLLGQTPSRKSA
jgi:PHD/YefM family antitoxin component YafN of YafNO toxin-antitoxin module